MPAARSLPSMHPLAWAGAAVLSGLMLLASPVQAAGQDARVFPLKAFFHDDKSDSTLDPAFRDLVRSLGTQNLAAEAHRQMTAAFGDRIGALDRNTAGRTFVASLQVSRATSYAVDKGTGNRDVLATVTASLYFTNVRTGEILKTLSETTVSQEVVAGAGEVAGATRRQFERSLRSVIEQLVKRAGTEFRPSTVDVRITDQSGSLLVLDTGYRRGIQVGDQLSDASGQLIEVMYASADHAVAQRVLADQVQPGATFQKYLAHGADGKVRPRTVVYVESVPQGYRKEHVAQLFSELVGDKAPLSIVLVSPGFSNLLTTVTQQAALAREDSARRRPPEYIIRLTLAEPIAYEARTNLEYQVQRHYETLAFAELIDTQGRVVFSVDGKDTIDDAISHGIGPGMSERREVSAKNALVRLAERFATLAEPKAERLPVMQGDTGLAVDTRGKAQAPQQKGVVLAPARVRLSVDGRPQDTWLPVSEAQIDNSIETARPPLLAGLPLRSPEQPLAAGQQFEIQRIGTAPKSSARFSLCPGEPENRGDMKTPSLTALATHALGSQMPGMFYMPAMTGRIDQLISPVNNFTGTLAWKLPRQIDTCIKTLEKVTRAEPLCSKNVCEIPMKTAYMLDAQASGKSVGSQALQIGFSSTGFYASTPAAQQTLLMEADVVDEAAKLLQKMAGELKLTP
ncbi:hypothetical protein [Sphaerotilus uruguayifluvii]|uniref:Curli production assembly/transport component CsgG n=1 Tax=Sphaerotilus uruguayifluvii TaxID=2735897 RepID=A0ABX2G186_9BURK|nr:hypothetical protein [Leptothrix sp. C29]NRT56027.1 hypothetical protein [Leptothrix sp. C29]